MNKKHEQVISNTEAVTAPMSHSGAVDNHILHRPVTEVKGVGEARAQDLSLLGIHTIEDLLVYFPYRYEDRRMKDLSTVQHEETVTLEGTIHSAATVRFYGRKKSRLTVKVLVDRYLVTLVLFNRHYAKNQFKIGEPIVFTGKLNKHRLQVVATHYKLGPAQEMNETDQLLPVYSVSGSVQQAYLRKIIRSALNEYGTYIQEIIPTPLLNRYKLMNRDEALTHIHLPEHFEHVKQAKRRFIYEEFFLFQLKVLTMKKVQRERIKGIQQAIDHDKLSSFIESLPFQLTNAQQQSLQQILDDMASDRAMNRLLQGDVGSGKTIVAAIALYSSILAGYQGAFMVPTEILAEQHFISLKKFFERTDLQIALLTGSTPTRERKDILAGLQMGTIDLIIGTHALIQHDVYFKALGLIITDEQHRFGVNQRRLLREKGESPDVLFMTATPIPRTLAITAFGDLDVSVIDELPKGRKPIETYWAKGNMADRVLHFMMKEVQKGRQAYFICPLIEESDKLDVQNAIDLHAELTEQFKQFRVGLLHGRLKSSEKEEVMTKFANHQIDVLVSTTVVEVGVNVPNASLIVIQDAERFGLSQLHQLRGRVGRGEHQSYCILIADPKTEAGVERMQIMTSTLNGFELAQKDLKLRGPGEFFGTKQSGLPEFKVADMIHDYKALECARQDVDQLIYSQSFWSHPEYARLRDYLKREGVLEQIKLD